MKILIVDDESDKLKRLKRELISIDGINSEDVVYTLELNIAKENISQQLYDFMILDLNMPEVLDEDPQPNAGIEFIEEIMGVDSYKKPKQIIVLTACPESEKEFKTRINMLGFDILKYDPSSSQWSEYLKAKIRYALMCENKTVEETKNKVYDVAIVTAVKVETEAVKKLSTQWKKEPMGDDSTTLYYTTEFINNGRKLNVVTAQQSEMGMTAAATLSCKIIERYRPKYIIMVGIAAGIGNEKNYGDIIVATEVWNYSSGKYVSVKEADESMLLQFTPEPKSIQLNATIAEIVSQDFRGKLFEIKQGWQEAPIYDLNLVCGPLACGCAVVSNKEIVEELIKKHSRKTVGLDMESYGIFYAARHQPGSAIPICIKSICDFADSEKGDNYQKYAAYTSANFTKYLIEEQLIFD